MPDSGALPVPLGATSGRRAHRRFRWVPPLLRRVLLVNALPLVLLLAGLLYLDQYQNGLLQAEAGTLREQARIFAGALGETAVKEDEADRPHLVPELARPLLRRLTEPTPNAQAKLYGAGRHRGRRQPGARRHRRRGDHRAAAAGGRAQRTGRHHRPHLRQGAGPAAAWQRAAGSTPARPPPARTGSPTCRRKSASTGTNQTREMPPYIRRTADGRLLVTVAEPVQRDRATVGIVLLTREAREVDDSLLAIRLSILGLFTLALGLTVMLSWYLSQTIARPILRLAGAADANARGARPHRRGAAAAARPRATRSANWPARCRSPRARCGRAWTRSSASPPTWRTKSRTRSPPSAAPSKRFAASRTRQAAPPARHHRRGCRPARPADQRHQRRLPRRRRLSRVAAEPIDVAPILATLAEINETTRDDGRPAYRTGRRPRGCVVVQAVEGRLVQVLRNLIGNAGVFSPPDGHIRLRAREAAGMVEISVEDEGPGIPEAKLEHIFDRFYSERPKGERFGQHSGLGLSISRQIVEALKGRISAENRRDDRGRILGRPLRRPPAGFGLNFGHGQGRHGRRRLRGDWRRRGRHRGRPRAGAGRTRGDRARGRGAASAPEHPAATARSSTPASIIRRTA